MSELRGRSISGQVASCAALRDWAAKALEHRMTARALRSTARRAQGLATEAAELEGEISRLGRRSRRGCGSCPGSGR